MNTRAKRRLTHSEAIHFRINAGLLDRVQHAAVSQGMSVAEFARAALRAELSKVAA
ncbi:hypothetical protein [Sphingomonas beigongshangi]|jgi:predicted HicB family RNase H-like nuclease|uniref:hypothetical protein n=1 Tax=Sphingomonas beigongshangi TaxID=2782540 RepID=UPI00193BA8D5|nr:hypothetical protein [Sphingomonas beigongshangi]